MATQSTSGRPLAIRPGPARSTPSSALDDAGDSSGVGPDSAPTDDSNELGSITRVVRDATGRPLAIVHVEPERSDASSSHSSTDATPDASHPGDRYAQINRAITGNPVIDRTTQFLLDALQQSIQTMGSGWGPLFGTRVHTDFARRVKELDLPGIGKDGVEQSFHLDWTRFVPYGLDDSIRTDVALRDPRHPDQGPIAVYDLKTGNAVLTPKRVEEIRAKVKQKDLPVIMLHYVTGDAVYPRGSNPPQ